MHEPDRIVIFLDDAAAAVIYTLSLHDALPISCRTLRTVQATASAAGTNGAPSSTNARMPIRSARSRAHASSKSASVRSEEHTSELQSQSNLACRLPLEQKNPARPSLPVGSPSA